VVAGPPAPEQREGCTLFLGQVAELSSLRSRDITYAVSNQGRISAFGPADVQVSYDESLHYRDFMGWGMPWYSAQPSLDALLRVLPTGDRVFETYWTNRRGVEAMEYGDGHDGVVPATATAMCRTDREPRDTGVAPSHRPIPLYLRNVVVDTYTRGCTGVAQRGLEPHAPSTSPPERLPEVPAPDGPPDGEA
jgi:hypothetical protein